jgi:hypothetical protein
MYQVEYLIAPKRTFQTEYSMFEARVEPGRDNLARSSELGGILETSPSRGLLPCTLGLLIGGSVILSLDSVLLTKWFGPADPLKSLDGVVALWLSKAGGAGLLGLGGYLGFRKLPLKS